ncbi:MAG: hypothetical protein COB02_15400 [Candidatus Cloacimonadota bacterium]|nr:MAG: hypothetical protein COB02_15400 [Candidatus Cloacimonadota bacterium]
MKKIIIISLLLIGLFLFWNSKPPLVEGKALKAEDTSTLISVFNKEFDSELKKYVDNDGNVDYLNWKKNFKTLDFLFNDVLSKIDTKTLKGKEKMAFFINVYNILTIKAMLRFYPLKSIMEKVSRVGGFHFWKDTYVQFSNEKYSLDQIEHKILRPMKDAKIHFAIVCASKSCPPLRNEVFLSENLKSQLEDQAFKFFAISNNFKIDRDKEIIYFSSILSWFMKDFSSSESTLLKSVSGFLPKNDKNFIVNNDLSNYSIKYTKYDWAINSK